MLKLEETIQCLPLPIHFSGGETKDPRKDKGHQAELT